MQSNRSALLTIGVLAVFTQAVLAAETITVTEFVTVTPSNAWPTKTTTQWVTPDDCPPAIKYPCFVVKTTTLRAQLPQATIHLVLPHEGSRISPKACINDQPTKQGQELIQKWREEEDTKGAVSSGDGAAVLHLDVSTSQRSSSELGIANDQQWEHLPQCVHYVTEQALAPCPTPVSYPTNKEGCAVITSTIIEAVEPTATPVYKTDDHLLPYTIEHNTPHPLPGPQPPQMTDLPCHSHPHPLPSPTTSKGGYQTQAPTTIELPPSATPANGALQSDTTSSFTSSARNSYTFSFDFVYSTPTLAPSGSVTGQSNSNTPRPISPCSSAAVTTTDGPSPTITHHGIEKSKKPSTMRPPATGSPSKKVPPVKEPSANVPSDRNPATKDLPTTSAGRNKPHSSLVTAATAAATATTTRQDFLVTSAAKTTTPVTTPAAHIVTTANPATTTKPVAKAEHVSPPKKPCSACAEPCLVDLDATVKVEVPLLVELFRGKIDQAYASLRKAIEAEVLPPTSGGSSSDSATAASGLFASLDLHLHSGSSDTASSLILVDLASLFRQTCADKIEQVRRRQIEQLEARCRHAVESSPCTTGRCLQSELDQGIKLLDMMISAEVARETSALRVEIVQEFRNRCEEYQKQQQQKQQEQKQKQPEGKALPHSNSQAPAHDQGPEQYQPQRLPPAPPSPPRPGAVVEKRFLGLGLVDNIVGDVAHPVVDAVDTTLKAVVGGLKTSGGQGGGLLLDVLDLQRNVVQVLTGPIKLVVDSFVGNCNRKGLLDFDTETGIGILQATQEVSLRLFDILCIKADVDLQV